MGERSAQRRRLSCSGAGAAAVLNLVAAAQLLSCTSPLPADEGCRDVGYSIANKSFECDGSVGRANTRYERFMSKHTCKEGGLPEIPGTDVPAAFVCSAAILDLSCAQVEAYADDFDLWLANSQGCAETYTAADGGDLPPPQVGQVISTVRAEGTIDGVDLLDVRCDVAVEGGALTCDDGAGSGIELELRELRAGTQTRSDDEVDTYPVRVTRVRRAQETLVLSRPETGDRLSLTISDLEIAPVADAPDRPRASYRLELRVEWDDPVIDVQLSGLVSGQACGTTPDLSPPSCPP